MLAWLLLIFTASAELLQLKPELYFGVRERKSQPFTFGLGWTTGNKFHFDCREPNEFKRWGFEKCNSEYGKQTFFYASTTISTEHVFNENGGMLLRVNGTSSETSSTSIVLVFDFPEADINLDDASEDGVRGDTVTASSAHRQVSIDWTTMDDVDDEQLMHDPNTCTEHTKRIRPGRPAPELARTHFTTFHQPDVTHNWLVGAVQNQFMLSKRRAMSNARSLLSVDQPVLLERLAVPVLNNKHVGRRANILVLQRVLRFPFSILVRVSFPTDATFAQKEAEFDFKFASKLGGIAANKRPQDQVKVAQAALANTIGSVGYFFGSNLLEDGTWTKPASALLTGVPSRSFFPRGFFWDEGFHQLLVSKFSPKLAQEVVLSWLQRFESNGWIAREQVLGQDAIDKVPREFLAQNRKFANPPTLLLAIESLMEQAGENVEFFQQAFDRFLLHKQWIEQSQRSSLHAGLLAWQGRIGIHTLPSGLDDYPRGKGKEAHVDLLAWSAWEDIQLGKLAQYLNKSSLVINALQESSRNKVAMISKHHWNEKLGFFNDLGDAGFAAHVGFVGLMPFVLKLVPAGAEFDKIVLHIEHSLLSPGIGLRSLAKFDPLFGQGENYWRGSVWININYLCIEALRYYSRRDNAPRLLVLADRIANDLIGNVVKQYWDTGFLFENYDSNTGRGRGTRPFTGWTALVTLLMNSTAVA